jgi:hypothetical protein
MFCAGGFATNTSGLAWWGEWGQRHAIQAFLADTDRLAADLAADRCRLSDSDNCELIRRCVVVALRESVFRSGMYTHLLPVPEQLINLVSDVVVADVEALYRSASTVFEPLAGPVRAGQVPQDPGRRCTALGAAATGRLLPARLRRHLRCPPGRGVLRP